MNKLNSILPFILILLVFSSCHQQKELGKKTEKGRSTSFLLEKLQENEFNCEWLSLKVGVGFKTDKLSDSFKMHVRLRKDSAIWISTTYYSVEVARFLITADTIKFMDRKANEYFIGKMDYLNEKFDLQLDFHSLQALMLGNSVGLSEDAKIKSYHSHGFYHISSLGKRKIKKLDKGKETSNDEIAYGVSLYPDNFKVAKLSIQDFVTDRSLFASFLDHTAVGEQLLPQKVKINIIADNTIEATAEYIKIQENKPLKLSFNIPDKYEKIDQ